jgi:TetR/AcrR family transcriptional regulator
MHADAMLQREQTGMPMRPIEPVPNKTRRATRIVSKGESSRDAILAAARAEFAAKGLAGARVDCIAARAEANKQLVYYYFGNKEKLYQAVLEAVYAEIRMREQALHLGDLPPDRAMEKLIAFSFDHLESYPDFIKLLNDENSHNAQHLRRSPEIERQNSPLIALIDQTLQRGVAAGLFRPGIDPLWLYVSIAGMAYFYFSNRSTLSTIFTRDLARKQSVSSYRAHVLAFAMAAVNMQPGGVQPNS